MATNTAIRFTFKGGDAEENQLNFYDASRFLYAAARHIYTLEYFRQTGLTLQRIRRRINADYRITTPQPGSWDLEIAAVLLPLIGQCFLQVPIDVLVAWVWGKVVPIWSPNKKDQELMEKLEARIGLTDVERTRQSEQETERLRLLLEFLQTVLPHQRQFSELQSAVNENAETILDLRERLNAEFNRRAAITQHSAELRKIDEDQERLLLSRSASQIVEMGKPLERSATSLSISFGESGRPFGYAKHESIALLEGLVPSPYPDVLIGGIFQFDKETGWGKFRPFEKRNYFSFYLPASNKNELRPIVIEAMSRDIVRISFYYVRDQSGVVKHLIIDNIDLGPEP